MKIKLVDPKNRVSRLIHRTTPGGELIILDLRFGFRGEIYYMGGCGAAGFLGIRCFSTSAHRWESTRDYSKFIRLDWSQPSQRTLLHAWSKGTCEILLAPLHKWMPMQSKSWTCLTRDKD